MSIPFKHKQPFRELFEFVSQHGKLSLDDLKTTNAYLAVPFPDAVVTKFSSQCPMGQESFMAFIAEGKKETSAEWEDIPWGYIHNFAQHQLFQGEEAMPLKPLRSLMDPVLRGFVAGKELTDLWATHVGATDPTSNATVANLVSLLRVAAKKMPLVDVMRALLPKGGKKSKVVPPARLAGSTPPSTSPQPQPEVTAAATAAPTPATPAEAKEDNAPAAPVPTKVEDQKAAPTATKTEKTEAKPEKEKEAPKGDVKKEAPPAIEKPTSPRTPLRSSVSTPKAAAPPPAAPAPAPAPEPAKVEVPVAPKLSDASPPPQPAAPLSMSTNSSTRPTSPPSAQGSPRTKTPTAPDAAPTAAPSGAFTSAPTSPPQPGSPRRADVLPPPAAVPLSGSFTAPLGIGRTSGTTTLAPDTAATPDAPSLPTAPRSLTDSTRPGVQSQGVPSAVTPPQPQLQPQPIVPVITPEVEAYLATLDQRQAWLRAQYDDEVARVARNDAMLRDLKGRLVDLRAASLVLDGEEAGAAAFVALETADAEVAAGEPDDGETAGGADTSRQQPPQLERYNRTLAAERQRALLETELEQFVQHVAASNVERAHTVSDLAAAQAAEVRRAKLSRAMAERRREAAAFEVREKAAINDAFDALRQRQVEALEKAAAMRRLDEVAAKERALMAEINALASDSTRPIDSGSTGGQQVPSSEKINGDDPTASTAKSQHEHDVAAAQQEPALAEPRRSLVSSDGRRATAVVLAPPAPPSGQERYVVAPTAATGDGYRRMHDPNGQLADALAQVHRHQVPWMPPQVPASSSALGFTTEGQQQSRHHGVAGGSPVPAPGQLPRASPVVARRRSTAQGAAWGDGNDAPPLLSRAQAEQALAPRQMLTMPRW